MAFKMFTNCFFYGYILSKKNLKNLVNNSIKDPKILYNKHNQTVNIKIVSLTVINSLEKIPLLGFFLAPFV